MIEKLTKSLFSYCNKNLGFRRPPRLFLKTDEENAANALGKILTNEKCSLYGYASLMKDRVNELSKLPLPDDWDGVYTAETK